ncbi:Hypothetical predicted protein [Paramuricea clavata]|uniref:Deoxyribonuclease NucA/NucB domain-containing protein n=1 Tax=Paramuricea clavata TaxID=317549 RepID=A0A6S7IWD7_PARCT|nr:Hypothetical predicted protein [Paramuricea clavata]
MKILLLSVCVVLLVAFTTANTLGDSTDEIENEESSLEKRARKCPTIVFPCGRGTTMPAVCRNMRDAIKKQGKPTRLHRVAAKNDINKNRRASGCPKLTILKRKKMPGFNCDEYPFASSKEGGKGSKIMMVPVRENSQQGGLLAGFYRKHGIVNGGCYNVKV